MRNSLWMSGDPYGMQQGMPQGVPMGGAGGFDPRLGGGSPYGNMQRMNGAGPMPVGGTPNPGPAPGAAAPPTPGSPASAPAPAGPKPGNAQQTVATYNPGYATPTDPSGWLSQGASLMRAAGDPGLQQQLQASDADAASRGLLYGGAAQSASDMLRGNYLADINRETAGLAGEGMGYQQQAMMYNAGAQTDANRYAADVYNNRFNNLQRAYLDSFGGPAAGVGMWGALGPGAGSTYGDIYGGSMQGQGAFWGGLGGLAGQVASGGFGGGGGGGYSGPNYDTKTG